MGLRFWRRIHFPGGSINLSKSGASLSLGVRGAHVTLGRTPRVTAGLPGTGLFWTELAKRGRQPRGGASSAAGGPSGSGPSPSPMPSRPSGGGYGQRQRTEPIGVAELTAKWAAEARAAVYDEAEAASDPYSFAKAFPPTDVSRMARRDGMARRDAKNTAHAQSHAAYALSQSEIAYDYFYRNGLEEGFTHEQADYLAKSYAETVAAGMSKADEERHMHAAFQRWAANGGRATAQAPVIGAAC